MRTLLILIFALGVSGCTALMLGSGAGSGDYRKSDDGRTPAQVTEDSARTATIRTRLGADPMVGAFNVHVTTDSSRVTLRGNVDSEEARSRARQIAAGVDGVLSVSNEIRVTQDR